MNFSIKIPNFLRDFLFQTPEGHLRQFSVKNSHFCSFFSPQPSHISHLLMYNTLKPTLEKELEEIRKGMEAEKGSFSYNYITRKSLKNSLALSAAETAQLLQSDIPHVIRMKVPENEEIRVNDLIRGWVVVHTSQMDDKVLFKSDGMPTYHLANVVDDYLMQITHVIRGEEWLPSAPLHVLLYRSFGWEDVMPQFAHLPLLLKPDGNGKLSKRDGDRLGFPVFPLNWKDPQSGELSSGYREKGYYPEAFLNVLALLGWHPSNNKELFSLDELVHDFSLERVSKSGAKFDPEKTKWFNEQYLRAKPDEQLAASLAELVKKEFGLSADDHRVQTSYLLKAVHLLKERVHFEHEMTVTGNYLFQQPHQYDEQVISKRWKPDLAEFFSTLAEKYRSLNSFTAEEAEKIFQETAAAFQKKPGDVLQLFRVMMSGQGGGVHLFGMVELFGPKEVTARLDKALSFLQTPSTN